MTWRVISYIVFLVSENMPCVSLSSWVEDKDKNGDRIGDWAHQVTPGHFQCKLCVPSKTLSFKKGKGDLLKHAESEKHKACRTANKAKSQQTLGEMLATREDNRSRSSLEFRHCSESLDS